MPTRFTPAVSLAAMLLLAACAQSDAPESPQDDTGASLAQAVRTTPVQRLVEPGTLAFAGVTRAAQRGELTFQVAGTLAQRPDIGARFAAGDTLATIYNPQLEPAADAATQQLEELRSRLAQARRDVERVARLHASDAATDEELERTRSALTQLQAAEQTAMAQANQARRMLAETRLVAPFDGTVSQVYVDSGEFITPGRPVLAVSGEHHLEVEVALPESLALTRRVGERADVRLPFVDRTVEGRIAEIASAAPGVGRLFPVVVSIAADGLRAGLTAEVLVPTATGPVLTVPLRAVVDPGGGEPRVYRLVGAGSDGAGPDSDGSGARAERVVVTVGDILGERVVITSGLANDDTVIVSGLARLIDGASVRVVD